MPYKNEAQRKFMHAQHPEIAKRWDKEMQRTVPEDNNPQDPKYKPSPTQNGFMRKIPELRKGAMGRRLKARVIQAKNGSTHEQHVAHVQHQQHLQNEFTRNQKSKNPYSK